MGDRAVPAASLIIVAELRSWASPAAFFADVSEVQQHAEQFIAGQIPPVMIHFVLIDGSSQFAARRGKLGMAAAELSTFATGGTSFGPTTIVELAVFTGRIGIRVAIKGVGFRRSRGDRGRREHARFTDCGSQITGRGEGCGRGRARRGGHGVHRKRGSSNRIPIER